MRPLTYLLGVDQHDGGRIGINGDCWIYVYGDIFWCQYSGVGSSAFTGDFSWMLYTVCVWKYLQCIISLPSSHAYFPSFYVASWLAVKLGR